MPLNPQHIKKANEPTHNPNLLLHLHILAFTPEKLLRFKILVFRGKNAIIRTDFSTPQPFRDFQFLQNLT